MANSHDVGLVRGQKSVNTRTTPPRNVDSRRSYSRWSEETTSVTEASSKRDSAMSAGGAPQRRLTTKEYVHNKTQKVKSIGRQTKVKTKHLLWKHNASPEEAQAQDDEFDDPYEELHNPAFEPSMLIAEKHKGAEATAHRFKDNLSSGIHALAHPIQAAKKIATSKVMLEDEPYLSDGADEAYLNAHDSLDRAKCASPRRRISGDLGDIEHNEARIRALDKARENRKVAWTTTHHIKRVIVVPKREVPIPRKENHYTLDKISGKQVLDWRSYLSARSKHNVLNFVHNSMRHVDYAGQAPFDRDTMIGQLERLLIAFSPWQPFLVSLRQLYRWEHPAKTGRWLFVWCIVWYMNYVVTFALAYFAFKVLENKYSEKKASAIRESYNRTRDSGKAAHRLTELINKHGDDWPDSATEELGKLQYYTSDVASFLEIMNNFYEWRAPGLTWASLYWLACAVVFGTLTSTDASMKTVWLFCISNFFLGFWVRSWYPQYRHIVNTIMWIFWDIPDDNEWSMMCLREKAQNTRVRLIERKVEKQHAKERSHASAYLGGTAVSVNGPIEPIDDMHNNDFYDSNDETTTSSSDSESSVASDTASFVSAKSSTSILDSQDILSFRAHQNQIRGHLTIYSSGLRFTRLDKSKEVWRHTWPELIEMRKTYSSLAPPGLPTIPLVPTKAMGLEFVFTNGETMTLKGVKGRDRAFNCIVGFSGLRFQVLPVVAEIDPRQFWKEMKGVDGGTW